MRDVAFFLVFPLAGVMLLDEGHAAAGWTTIGCVLFVVVVRIVRSWRTRSP